MFYYLTILKPVNNKIASHIVDGDNWEAISGLWYDINPRYDEDIIFTQADVLEITSAMERLLCEMCYITDNGETYTVDGNQKIYSAKQARAMIPFLKECNGFTIKQINVNQEIVDDYD